MGFGRNKVSYKQDASIIGPIYYQYLKSKGSVSTNKFSLYLDGDNSTLEIGGSDPSKLLHEDLIVTVKLL
jgi:hypothetical protein